MKAFQTATLFDTCSVEIELFYFTDSITTLVCAAVPTADVTDIVGVLGQYVFTSGNEGSILIVETESTE